MDLKPYIFKTTDYGASWTKIVNGIKGDHTFVRVVREDTKRKGLLYAGTETGLFMSFDDGQNWQAFQLNLPVVPINDLVIQDNDLVVATAGRSFWILDDLGAIQNIKDNQSEFKIFQPKNTYRIFGGSSDKAANGNGQNPKSGVTFDYYLPKIADTLDLKLEVLENNTVIRTYSNKSDKKFKTWRGGPPKPEVLPSKQGYNRFTWNFNRETLPAVDNVFVFGNYNGSSVTPGEYTLRLTLEDDFVETKVLILPNPKVRATTLDFNAQHTILMTIEDAVRDIHESVNAMRSAKAQLKGFEKLLKDNETAKFLIEKGDTLIKRINTWEENLIQPNQKTFQDVINFHNQLNSELMNLKDYIDTPDPKITQGAKERLNDLIANWNVYKTERDAIINIEMKAYNKLHKSLDLPAIIIMDKN